MTTELQLDMMAGFAASAGSPCVRGRFRKRPVVIDAAEWADTAPASYGTIRQRLAAGWPAEKALSTPTKQ